MVGKERGWEDRRNAVAVRGREPSSEGNSEMSRDLKNLTFVLKRSSSFFKRVFKDFFIFRERRREGERDGEKHQCMVASRVPPTGDLTGNPGMCPNWEWNRQPFGLQSGAQSIKPHHPGWFECFLCWQSEILAFIFSSFCGYISIGKRQKSNLKMLLC